MTLATINSAAGSWYTGPEYQQSCPTLTADKFLQVTNLLLEKPNLNSTHLFRADILHDSTGALKTVDEREQQCRYSNDGAHVEEEIPLDGQEAIDATEPAPTLEGARLERKVLRKLIPRKPQLDRALDQWCYIYNLVKTTEIVAGHVVVYVPIVARETEMPWYHPPVKSLAYLYQQRGNDTTLSVHFVPFESTVTTPLPSRLHRTFISLLQTFLRLAKSPAPEQDPHVGHRDDSAPITSAVDASMAPSALKDTILPQHVVQNTYTRLKQRYAQDLISRWAESTEPSKHVFEDLSIAAFVIELWKQMYSSPNTFPGFVDIACGNGVLTYVLIQEGYRGRGFDARRRKTWAVLGLDQHLDEMICVPQPFVDHAPADMDDLLSDTRVHSGLFEPGTFIISNHADELTPWTPILAALSCPGSPLPFLSIPCCSHALSGAKHRYSPAEIKAGPRAMMRLNDKTEQPATGDLKALRAAKAKAATHTDDKSMYACLTRKTVALAEEVGCNVELTLMRIPSTRNIGIVGNRKRLGGTETAESSDRTEDPSPSHEEVPMKIQALLERECAISGGMGEAAKTWIERARKLQTGTGRGKINLRGKPDTG
ncbi:hypothetical protein A1O1_08375 [Capronia coronata CBS 617.96]|uniref:tRNA (uracil-O(2)-)-methyltransferase n=1 Tax=Capronia coronata CBS 617.96 TaxID=1182541 RepID=W9XJ33_9EURO|nr:uncharacterized protein A1O1_08375 [Capronia coronata CBS 617.96]EXJ80233.1 hypothetical protein A1O1_08375 [Capronia coronata CBS 617.96]